MSLQDTTTTTGVTVRTEHTGVAGKQDVVTVSLRDIDPDLTSEEVEALIHRAVVRGLNDYYKETSA